MDKTELRTALQTLGVPMRIYSLSGNQADERVCLYQYNGEWRVSFFERGQERLLGAFSTESEACEFMLGKLKHEV
jgi:hypothetical protein